MQADNSFFHNKFNKLKVLLLVPHEDDEINTAGSFVYTLSRCGADISLIYTTNGDWKYSAEKRFEEAINSATLFGISEENIYFLGYGDAINSEERNHLFYHYNTVACSAAGHTETYGTNKHPDFAFQRENMHHAYLNKNYLKDLVEIICLINPNLIICTDFDEHPDHRMLSLYFDKAIGLIKKKISDFNPEIWKSFAYALAYTAISDYSIINNPETQRPEIGTTGKYELDIIDKFYYQWQKRIRIPIPSKVQNCSIRNNFIAKALQQHKSQFIILKADSIINSDEVFWSRRTDSISYSAKVEATSGHKEYLTDFMIYNVRNIDNFIPEFEDYFWQPDENDVEKKVMFSWPKAVTIEKIVLYGAVSQNGKIEKLLISLSDSYQKIITDFPQNGNPVEVFVGRHENITFCEVKILSATGQVYGISECEFYSVANFISCINPFCKILVNDNFVYEYVIDENIKTVSFDCYCYGIIDSITICVEKGKSTLNKGKLLIDKADKEIILKAQNESGDIWDRIVVKRLSREELNDLRKIDLLDKKYLRQKRREKKFYNMIYILRHEGLFAVFKRILKNVIRPALIKRKL